MKALPICFHNNLRPTDWNQPKPEPKEMTPICGCGQNYVCSICGYGSGTWPCSCTKETKVDWSKVPEVMTPDEIPLYQKEINNE